jgi:hypothetical protein
MPAKERMKKHQNYFISPYIINNINIINGIGAPIFSVFSIRYHLDCFASYFMASQPVQFVGVIII